MAKRDNAIKDIVKKEDLEDIIKRCQTCHLGMVDGDKPYVLGFNFGYQDGIIYLHCAKEGKKIDILKKNNNVCVYFNADFDIFARHEQVACSWRMRYRSVLVNGKALIIEDYEEKLKCITIFMKHYSNHDFVFSKPSVDNILIIKIKVDEWTGRSFEYL